MHQFGQEGGGIRKFPSIRHGRTAYLARGRRGNRPPNFTYVDYELSTMSSPFPSIKKSKSITHLPQLEHKFGDSISSDSPSLPGTQSPKAMHSRFISRQGGTCEAHDRISYTGESSDVQVSHSSNPVWKRNNWRNISQCGGASARHNKLIRTQPREVRLWQILLRSEKFQGIKQRFCIP